MSGTDSLESLFTEYGREKKPRKRGRGWLIAGIIVGVLVILLVAAYFILDSGLRSTAQSVAAGELQGQLGSDETGPVKVKIGGTSVIQQYAQGSFQDVHVSVPKVTVNGVTAAVTLTAHGVSTDLSKPVPDVTGTVSLDQASLNKAFTVPGATSPVALGQGVLSFNATQSVAGIPVSFGLTVTPSVQAGKILLTPKAATITSGLTGAAATAAVSALLAQPPTPVCVADYLPKSATVTGITVTPSAAIVAFDAKNLVLSSSTLSDHGSCS